MKHRVLAIIQARMGSTRLPGKVLLPIIDNKSALQLMLERVVMSKKLNRIIVATTVSSEDNRLVELCERLNIACFRGSEQDVLDRYYQAAYAFGPAQAIIRLTGDCPLHDPAIIDEVIEQFQVSGVNYCSNINPPTYPDGLDVEVFTSAALGKAWQNARLVSEREHVTLYIRNHPELFSQINVSCASDYSCYRWTLDEEQDYQFIKRVFKHFYPCTTFTTQEIISFLGQHPEIAALNSSIERNAGLLKSLAEDKECI